MRTLETSLFKRWRYLFIFALAPLIFFSPVIGLELYNGYAESRLTKQGDLVREKVEGYRAIHGEFPASLEAAGIANPGTPSFYYSTKADSFRLMCSLSVGVDIAYSSKTGQWVREAY